MLKTYLWPFAVMIFALLSGIGACKHEPFLAEDDDITPIDTTIITPPDTTTMSGKECDPDSVYFQQQVLPVLRSNCAISGCHDATTAEDGIILDTYASVLATGKIKAGNPGDSEVHEKITETRESERMPPPPMAKLTAEQIKLIGDWITQGAEDLTCDANAGGGGCNTTDVSFSRAVSSVISNTCLGCHNGAAASGGVNLNGYANIRVAALSGRLVGAISWQPGYAQMPQGSAKLSQCTIDQIRSWVEAGAPEN